MSDCILCGDFTNCAQHAASVRLPVLHSYKAATATLKQLYQNLSTLAGPGVSASYTNKQMQSQDPRQCNLLLLAPTKANHFNILSVSLGNI